MPARARGLNRAPGFAGAVTHAIPFHEVIYGGQVIYGVGRRRRWDLGKDFIPPAGSTARQLPCKPSRLHGSRVLSLIAKNMRRGRRDYLAEAKPWLTSGMIVGNDG
jgi:hypothetical protein